MNRSSRRVRCAFVVEQACFETLEARRMLHAGHMHVGLGQPGYVLTDHVLQSDFVRQHPELAGKDLWDASTFDPKGTGDTRQFLYDPHMVIDERVFPAPTPGLNAAAVTALPDIVPLKYGTYLSPYIDTTEITGRNLMRFSSAVGNMGPGPLSLVSSNGAVDPQGRQIVTQNVYKYDAVTETFSFDYARDAGRFVWHSGHGHFHFEGYARYRLLQNNGGVPGAVVNRPDGSPAIGDKIGFCLINILNTFTRPDTGTSSSSLPGWNDSGQPGTGCGFLQGISVGKADVYDSVYDGQWIDVTGVPNGNYFLEVTMDADNVVLESNENNNVALVAYNLQANPPSGGIQADRFEPNNTFATSTDLGESGLQTQAGLTIHITDESDYFKFVATSSGNSSVQLTVGNRDVNLYLYDSNQNLLGISTSPANGPMTETVNWNFVKGQTYYVLARGFGTDTGTGGVSSSYAVKINVNPTVDALAPTPQATPGTPGVLRIFRNGPTSSPLTVNLTYSGTGVAGVDYDALPAQVIIGNETSYFDLAVTIKPNANLGAGKTVIANVSASSAYAIGTNGATISLIDNVAPTNVSQGFSYAASPQALTFRFSENVQPSLAASDLSLMNLTTGLPMNANAVAWDSLTNTASFTFSSPLPNGSYNAVVAGANVTDPSGNALTGDAVYNFIWASGSGAQDVFRIDRDAPGTNVRVYFNSASPSYVGDGGALNGIFLVGGDGDDLFTLDLANGAATPSAQFIINGGNNNDTLAVVGTAGAETIAFNASTVVVGGATVTHSNLESAGFNGLGGFDTVNVNGGPTVTFSASQKFDALNIASGASARVAGGAGVAIVTRALTIAGTGTLDLNDSALVLDYTGATGLTSIQSLINSGRAGGAWTGPGLTSTAARNASPKNTTLAAIEATDYKLANGAAALFAGESVDTSAVLVRYTYYGDSDFNGIVDFDDYSRVDAGFNGNNTGWFNGDVDGNGIVDFDDYSLIDLAFNTQTGPLRPAALVPSALPKSGKGAAR
ncbi:MAG: pre-peptidase C-terminal domain-containing protein [Anaerolineae bacterium]|nr:pre-peptidase C-terminal domain-containing protein [Phycisphaerae bacterium]